MAQEGTARPATRPRSAPRRGLPFADLGSWTGFALVAAMLFVWLPRVLEDFLYRIVVTLNSTPFVALASLAVVWFGLGITSKIIIAGMYTFFAVLYTTHKEFVLVGGIREEL